MSYVDEADLAATGPGEGANMVGFSQIHSTIDRTVNGKLREVRSFEDFGALPDGQMTPVALRAAIVAAWESALENEHDLFHPGGVYDIGEFIFPWRGPDVQSYLLDCKNITIYGIGPRSVFKTSSASGEGADVFALGAMKNIHFRNLAVTADIGPAVTTGSNGISVSGPFDNISLLNIWCDRLPSLDYFDPPHIDGGKALTIQANANPYNLPIGSLTARIFAKGCAIGFGLETKLDDAAWKSAAITVDLVAEDCWTAVQGSAGAVTGSSFPVGLSVRAKAINCQKDVVLARMHGAVIDCQIITSKSATDRRLDPWGRSWWSGDTTVEALLVKSARNCRIAISGSKGDCDYKARVGAASYANVGEPTVNSTFVIDIAGTMEGATSGLPAVEEIEDFDESVSRSTFIVTANTGLIASGFATPGRNNLTNFVGGSMFGAIRFADGSHATAAEVKIQDGGVAIRQVASAVPGQPVLVVLNDANARCAAVRNDGALMSEAVVSASAGGTIAGAIPFYDNSNTLVGYAMLHSTYTP